MVQTVQETKDFHSGGVLTRWLKTLLSKFHVYRSEKIGETPQTQIIQSARTSESSVTTPVCQMTQAGIGEVIEIGASIPAESESSVFVTAPVLENSPVVVESVQPAHVAEYMALAPTVSCTDAVVAHATRPLPATTMAVAHRLVDEKPADDIVSEIRDLKSDLVHIRELLGVLVRKERPAEAKAETAARKLDKMERERDQESEAECEATLEEALTNQSKVVKVIIDKWFVDKGFGFGKTPPGQSIFVHASAVQGAEVLKIGIDARVQVVNDEARAQGGYRARRAWGQDAWKAEKDKERANKVAQQVRRVAALTAELAAQSEKKTAAVCDQPPGFDELAGHIEAPNMEAGGSHPQIHGPRTNVPEATTRPKPVLPPRQVAFLQRKKFSLKPEFSVALDFVQPHELRRHVREVRT